MKLSIQSLGNGTTLSCDHKWLFVTSWKATSVGTWGQFGCILNHINETVSTICVYYNQNIGIFGVTRSFFLTYYRVEPWKALRKKKNLDLETNIYLGQNFCIKKNGNTSFNAGFYRMCCIFHSVRCYLNTCY